MVDAGWYIQNMSILPSGQRADFLLRLAFNATVVAREIGQRDVDDGDKNKMYSGLFEIQHKIISSVIARTSASNKGYPDDVLVEIITGAANSHGLAQFFQNMWEMSWPHKS